MNFIETPKRAQFKNNASALSRKDFVESEIFTLLKDGRIVEKTTPPLVVNPLTVADNGTKLRLILDLRYVNQHLAQEYVRYDDWRVFENYVYPNSWLFKFDLKSGYHHIDLHAEVQEFFGFSWEIEGNVRHFVYTVLVFGLAPAPKVFTKVLRPLTTFWREKGVKIAVYLDDGAGNEFNLANAKNHSRLVKETLVQAGFVINEDKSIWEPSKIITWLGVTVDTVQNIYYISEKRITKCKIYLTYLLASA